MTCVYNEYEVKNRRGAMTTAKKNLQGYNMKIENCYFVRG